MGSPEHEWSPYELQTLLALLARGTHIPARARRNDIPGQRTREAYLNTATALNVALNGEAGGFGSDVPKRAVFKMIDRLMIEKKAIPGPGGLLERQRVPRLTRGLRRAFERRSKMDFNGSELEWRLWRKEQVMGVAVGDEQRVGMSNEPSYAIPEGRVDSGVRLGNHKPTTKVSRANKASKTAIPVPPTESVEPSFVARSARFGNATEIYSAADSLSSRTRSHIPTGYRRENL